MEDKKDLYIINKLIMASCVEEALKNEKSAKVIEVFIDNDWKKNKIDRVINNRKEIGF